MVANETGNAGNVDDGAAAVASHFGDGGLGAEEHALGVYVEDVVPKLFGGVLDAHLPVDAGVVDQDVQLAESLDGGADGGVPVVLAGDVQADEDALSAGLVDFGLQLPALVFKDVSDDDLAAFAGEKAGFGGALPAGTAADQGDLVFQTHRNTSDMDGGQPSGPSTIRNRTGRYDCSRALWAVKREEISLCGFVTGRLAG